MCVSWQQQLLLHSLLAGPVGKGRKNIDKQTFAAT